jgi:hypothetical protein
VGRSKGRGEEWHRATDLKRRARGMLYNKAKVGWIQMSSSKLCLAITMCRSISHNAVGPKRNTGRTFKPGRNVEREKPTRSACNQKKALVIRISLVVVALQKG